MKKKLMKPTKASSRNLKNVMAYGGDCGGNCGFSF